MEELSSVDRPDVFISHAHEDKDEVARPLALELRGNGLKVWYDEFALKLGDPIYRGIEKALSSTRFGVAVLSHQFFEREWTKRELSAFIDREISGEKVLLPLWHRITHEYVLKSYPILAGRFAISTSRGIPFIAEKIMEVIAPEHLPTTSPSRDPLARLFTYGTAISLEQLSRFLGWSLLETTSVFCNPRIGILRNYRLVFSTPFSESSPGRGTSNLEYLRDSNVEGVVYDVDQLTLAELERRIKRQYWLVPVEIAIRGADVLECHTFIATTPRSGLKPHRKFIDYMIKASVAAGLSAEFVESLREYDVLPGEAGGLF